MCAIDTDIAIHEAQLVSETKCKPVKVRENERKSDRQQGALTSSANQEVTENTDSDSLP